MDEWLLRRGLEKGAVLGLQQCWGFTKEWYGDRADADWQPKSAEETQAIFAKHGLTGDFWRVV